MSAALLENVSSNIVENGRKRGGSVSIALPNANVARTDAGGLQSVQRRSRKTSINGVSYRNGGLDSDSDINRNTQPNPHSRSHSRSHAHSRSRSEVQSTNTRSRKDNASSRLNYRPASRNRRNSLSSDNSSDTSSTLTLTGSGSKISARTLLGIVLRSHLKTVAALRDELAEMKEKVDTSEAQSQATTQNQGTAQALTITAPQPTHPPADPNPILLTRLRTLSSTHATTTHQLQRTQAELALYKASYARAQDLLVEANAYIRDVEDERDGLIGEVEEAWGLVKRGRRTGGGGGGAIQDVGGTRYGERRIVDDRDAEDEGVSGMATRDREMAGTRPPAPVQQNSNQPPPLFTNDRDRPRSSSTHATNVTQIHYPASALSAGSSTAFSSSSPPPPRPPSSQTHPNPSRTNTTSPVQASPTPPNPPRSRSASITGSTPRSGPRRVPVPSIAQVLTRAQQNEQTPKQVSVPASQLSREIPGDHDEDGSRTRNGDYRRDVEGGPRDLFGQGYDARARSPQNNVSIPFPSREHDSSAPSSSREMVLASSSVPNQLTSRDTAHEGRLGAEHDRQIPQSQNRTRAHFGTPQHPIPVPISNAGETFSPLTSDSESDTVTGNDMGNLNSFYNAPRSNSRPFFDTPPTSNINAIPASTSRLGPRPMTPHSRHLNVSAIPENITIRSPEVPHAYTENSNSSSSFPQAGASMGTLNRARTPGPGARRAVIQIAPSADADADVGSPTETSESSTVGGEDDQRGGGRRGAGDGREHGIWMQMPGPSGTTRSPEQDRVMGRPASRLEREDSALGLSGMAVALRAPETNTSGLDGAQDARQRAREQEQRRREAQFQNSPASTHSEIPSPPPPPSRPNGRQPIPPLSSQGHQAHLYTRRPRMNSSTSSSSSSGSGGDIRMRTGGRGGIATPIATPVGIRAQSPTLPTSPVSIQAAHPASHMHRPIAAIPIAPSSAASAGRDIHIQCVQSPAESRSSTGSPGTPTQRRLRRMSGLSDLSVQHVVNPSNMSSQIGHVGNGERVRQRENNRWSSSTRTSSTVPQIHIEPPSRSESGETIHTLSRHPIQIPASDFNVQHTDLNLLSPEHALQPLPFEVPSDALVPHGYREHGVPGGTIPVIPSRPMSPVTGFDHRAPIFIAPSDASGRSTPDMHFGERSGGMPAGSGLGFRGPIAIPLSSVEEELPPGFVPHTAIVPDSPDFTHGQSFPTSRSHHTSPPSINGFPPSHQNRVDSMSRPLPVPQEVVALGGAADTDEGSSRTHLPLTRRITDYASEVLGRRSRGEAAEPDVADTMPPMPRRATTPAPTRVPPSASRAQGHAAQSFRSESPVLFAPIPISISDHDSEANLSDLESTTHSETSRPRGGYNAALRRREGDYFTSNHHQERNFSRFNDPPAIQAFS